MKKMKKFLALAMAAAMVLSTGVTAFGAFTNANTPASSTETPKVTNVAKETTAMTAYSVITATDDGHGVVTYHLEDWAAQALVGKTFDIGSKTDVTLVTKTAATATTPVKYDVDMEMLIIGLGGYLGTDAKNGQKQPNNTPVKTQTNEILTAIADGDKTQASVQEAATGLTATTTKPATSLQTAKFEDLAVGYYYVEATDSKNVYNPMSVAVGLVAADAIANTDPVEYTGKYSGVYAQNSVGKYTEVPLVKQQTNADGTTNVSGDYQVGDTVDYKITTHIPNYDLNTFTAPVFTVTDILDLGLDAVTEISVKIGDGTAETWTVSGSAFTGMSDTNIATSVGNVYEQIPDPDKQGELKDGTTKIGTTFVINFGPAIIANDCANSATYLDKDVEIVYSTKLNKNALTGFDVNVNTAKLKYSRTPDVVDDSKKVETYSYTFAIDGSVFGKWKTNGWEIKKTGEGTYEKSTTDYIESDNKALEDAEFTIYVADSKGTETVDYYRGDNTSKRIKKVTKLKPSTDADPDLKGTNPYVTTDDGRITFEGLNGNTVYYIAETKAPEGYSLNTEVTKVEFKPTYDSQNSGKLSKYEVWINDTKTFTYEADAPAAPAEIKINQGTITFEDDGSIDVSTQTLDDTTEIKNTKLASLPSTGGIGTTIFTVAGILIMIAAAAIFFAARKKKA